MVRTSRGSLHEHVNGCPHPACAATRRLMAHGARLVLGKGRHCEMAALAAAGADGMTDAELVQARRAYAVHLGVSLAGRTNGTVADADFAIHARWAADGNVAGMPNAAEPIPIGSTRVARTESGRGR